MKTRDVSRERKSRPGVHAGPLAATDLDQAARAARAAIQDNPDSPENYAALAGALRQLSQLAREQNALDADHLLHLACAAAWEARRLSGPGMISGRTKQEIKTLIAWLRTKNHLGPEAAEKLMDRIHSEYLDRALDDEDANSVR